MKNFLFKTLIATIALGSNFTLAQSLSNCAMSFKDDISNKTALGKFSVSFDGHEAGIILKESNLQTKYRIPTLRHPAITPHIESGDVILNALRPLSRFAIHDDRLFPIFADMLDLYLKQGNAFEYQEVQFKTDQAAIEYGNYAVPTSKNFELRITQDFAHKVVAFSSRNFKKIYFDKDFYGPLRNRLIIVENNNIFGIDFNATMIVHDFPEGTTIGRYLLIRRYPEYQNLTTAAYDKLMLSSYFGTELFNRSTETINIFIMKLNSFLAKNPKHGINWTALASFPNPETLNIIAP